MKFLRSKPLNTSFVLLLALFLSSSVAPQLQHAQTTEIGFADRAARAELHQSLLDLTNSFTVLCVAAHPDD